MAKNLDQVTGLIIAKVITAARYQEGERHIEHGDYASHVPCLIAIQGLDDELPEFKTRSAASSSSKKKHVGRSSGKFQLKITLRSHSGEGFDNYVVEVHTLSPVIFTTTVTVKTSRGSSQLGNQDRVAPPDWKTIADAMEDNLRSYFDKDKVQTMVKEAEELMLPAMRKT